MTKKKSNLKNYLKHWINLQDQIEEEEDDFRAEGLLSSQKITAQRFMYELYSLMEEPDFTPKKLVEYFRI